MSKVNSCHDTISGACGVGVVYDFRLINEEYFHGKGNLTLFNKGGANWLTAGFILGNETSDIAFKELSDKYKLVFKTSVRKNKNSGNRFYFCVFDTYGSGVPFGYDDCEELE